MSESLTIDKYSRNELLNLLQVSKEPINIQSMHLNNLYHLLYKQKRRNAIFQRKYKHIKILNILIPALLIFFAVAGFIPVMYYYIPPQKIDNKFYINIFIIAIAIYFFILLLQEVFIIISYRISKIIYINNTNSNENKCKNIINTVNDIRAKNQSLYIIPSDYQSTYVIDILSTYLINYRADSWMSAINLYEHEKQVATISRQLEDQKKMIERNIKLLRSIQTDISIIGLCSLF